MSYSWSWHVLVDTSPVGGVTFVGMLLSGLRWTVLTAIGAWIIAFVFGGAIGIARTLPWRWVARAAGLYVEVFRSIPLLVQLFLWYFVLPEMLPRSTGMWLKQLPGASFYTAVVGLGMFTSARIAEQFRAGLQSLPHGQRLAAAALGLSLPQTYCYVLLPMALRVILPPLGSELLNTVKNTSMALTIGLAELTAEARAMEEFTFHVFEAFSAAALLYLLTNMTVAVALRVLERRVAVPGYIVGH